MQMCIENESQNTDSIFKLLIVDDQKTVREGLKKMIDSMMLGFSAIFEADNGQRALDIILTERPNIVLSDIMMTGMDGLTMVEELRKINCTDIHVIFISAYDRFDYAKKAVDLRARSYLLKPVSNVELFQTLVELKNEIWRTKRQTFETELHEREYYSMLLYEYITGKNQLVNVKRLYDGTGIQTFAYNYYCVVLAKEQHEGAGHADLPGVYGLTECVCEENTMYIKCTTPNETVYIVNLASKEPGQVNKSVQTVMGGMPEMFCFGISECMEGLGGLVLMYQHANLAQDDCRFSQTRVSYYDNLVKCGQNILSIREYKRYINLIVKNETEELAKFIDSLFLQIKRSKTGKAESINIIRRMRDYLCIHLEGLSEALEEAGMDNDSITQCDSYISMKAKILEVSTYACDWHACKNGNNVYEAFFVRINEYICNNYTKDISLAYIANKFDINYYYLSNMIKRKFNYTYSNYLAKLRLEKAEDLLLHSSYKVYEIAEMVGYSDAKYFCRLFKKNYLVSPENFRRTANLNSQQ
jgi:two-component system, response regulator YesN